MLTLIADSNIAQLTDYFSEQILGQPIHLISMPGRDISAEVIDIYQPDALLIRSVTTVDEQLLAGNSSVKFVGSATIGTDHVDQAYLAQRGISFANASGCSKHSVAQYVMTAILNLRPHYWRQPITLGIIGLGNIGSTLAKYATDLGWQVLGYDPLLPASLLNNASFAEVVSQSDVISLHVPLTTASQSPYPTYHLLDASVLASMSASTLLINSARGAVISEADLRQDLANTQRQVVLDVFEHEPVVSSQLLQQLAIATPHIAGYTLEGKLRGTQMIFDQFIEVFQVAVQGDPSQRMSQLLPSNPYRWSQLLAEPDKLSEFYDLNADDRLLDGAVENETKQVPAAAFDRLRKDYSLRREWLYC